MTEQEDIAMQALFARAKQQLPGAAFMAETERRVAHLESTSQLLALVQGAVLLSLFASMTLAAADHIVAWIETALSVLVANPWSLAGAIGGLALLLSPMFSRT